MASFEDHFSGHAADYARFRPSYPTALFDFLASLTSGVGPALDVACGTGQATRALAAAFPSVIAADGSRAQLSELRAPDHVRRLCSVAGSSGLAPASIELVCVAQALHWFDQERFRIEVARVLRPGGVVAAFCYGLFEPGDDAVADVLRAFHERVRPHWPARRALVEEGYSSLELPWRMQRRRFSMEESWDMEQLLGYLGTWTATKQCADAEGCDPVADVREELVRAWNDPARERRVVWPVHLMWSRAPGD